MAQMGVMDASLCPPFHGRSVDKGTRRRPRWVLLDKLAYFAGADVRNATTATSKTREGHEIQVTLCTAAQPQLVSYVCVHSPTLNPASDDYAMEPQIIAAHDDLLLIRLILGRGNRFTVSLADYFVYQASIADDIPPSLTRITHPGPMITFTNHEVAILHYIPEDTHHHPYALRPHNPLSSSSKQHYIVTAFSVNRYRPPGEYKLHLYHSHTQQWTTTHFNLAATMPPLPDLSPFHHRTTNVINLTHQSPGLMAFVDLWQGLLLINVLDKVQPAAPRYIPLPPPLKQGKVISGRVDPTDVRDIAVDAKGHINFVELEVDAIQHESDRTGYISQGWTVAKWSCSNTESDDCCWHMDCKLNASDISHLMPPELPNYCHPTPTLERLHIGHPLLSLDNNGDVVYFMAKVDHRDYKAWVIPVDMRKRLIHEPAVFEGAPRTLGIGSTFIQTTISNYPQPAPGRKQKQPGMLLGSSSKRKSETPYLTNVVLPLPTRHGVQKQPDAEGGSMEAEFSDNMLL
uniref:DUF1618 domain-containing protein n=1 Tax=Oryza nivara TaxID=4536 RepID=A0A0E0GFQ5_ORYNI